MQISKYFRNKKFIVLLVVGAVAIFGLFKTYQYYKYGFINDKLQSTLDKKTDGIYSITYDSISVDEIAGDLFISNLRIRPDTTLQLEYIKAGDKRASPVLLDITIPLVQLTGLKTPKALLSKNIECANVLLQSPKIKLYFFPGIDNKSDTAKNREQFYKQLLGNLTQIKAEKIQVTNGEIIASDYYSGATKFHVANTSISFTEVAVDSSTMTNAHKTFFSKRVQVISDTIILGNNNNGAIASKILFDTDDNSIKIGMFTFDAIKNNGFFKSEIKDIALKGFSWKGQPDQSIIEINHAVLGHANIQFTSAKTEGTGSANKKILNGWIKKFSLAQLEIKETDLLQLSGKNSKPGMQVNNQLLKIRNIVLDTTASFDKSLANHLGSAIIESKLLALSSADNSYHYNFSNLSFNATDKQIAIGKFEIIPSLSETDFAKKAKVQKDRFQASFNNIEASQVDMASLFGGEIKMQSLKISDNTIKISRDTRYPLDSISKVGNYPHQLLANLPFAIFIKKANLFKTYIEYKETNAITNEAGLVKFINSNLQIENIKNRNITKNDSTTAHFTTNFLHEIPVEASFVFYLNNINTGRFSMAGKTLKPFNVTLVNKLIQPLSAARFDQGIIHQLSFSINGDNLDSEGEVQLIFDKLKITLLKKKNGEFKKKDFLSLVANLLVVNKSNLNGSSEKQRAAAINKRDIHRSFFNHIWKTLMNGFIKIIA